MSLTTASKGLMEYLSTSITTKPEKKLPREPEEIKMLDSHTALEGYKMWSGSTMTIPAVTEHKPAPNPTNPSIRVEGEVLFIDGLSYKGNLNIGTDIIVSFPHTRNRFHLPAGMYENITLLSSFSAHATVSGGNPQLLRIVGNDANVTSLSPYPATTVDTAKAEPEDDENKCTVMIEELAQALADIKTSSAVISYSEDEKSEIYDDYYNLILKYKYEKKSNA